MDNNECGGCWSEKSLAGPRGEAEQCLPCASCLLPSHSHLAFFFFFRLFLTALEDKLNEARFINFASAWNNFDAFGMLQPGKQAHRPDLLPMQGHKCCWDPQYSASYCFPGLQLLLTSLVEVILGR